MHTHDDQKGHGFKMMWMMLICCALPLVLIFLTGAGGKALGAPAWIMVGVVAAMVVAHFFMMGRSHKHSDGEQSGADGEGENKDSKNSKTHSSHGCCH